MFNVTVEDKQDNNSVASVNATFQYPNTTRINVSLYRLVNPSDSAASDQESGERAFRGTPDTCAPNCPTNVQRSCQTCSN